MKHTTHSEQELEKKLEAIIDTQLEGVIVSKGSIHRINLREQIMQLIQSEREKVLEEVLQIIKDRDPEDYFGDIELKIQALAQKEESK